MRLAKKTGQSTIEYLIILAVVIAAIIFIAVNYFGPNIETLLNRASQKPDDMLSGDKMLGPEDG